jgi:hypothetical protein
MYNCTCTTKTSVYSTIHTTITLEDIFFIPHIYKGMFETMILKIRHILYWYCFCEATLLSHFHCCCIVSLKNLIHKLVYAFSLFSWNLEWSTRSSQSIISLSFPIKYIGIKNWNPTFYLFFSLFFSILFTRN